MAVAVVKSRALAGMHAPEVVVEAHLANGLPAFTLVGLPETEVKEARDRVRAAIQNARYEFPARRITVNLAPADLPKESGRFDLPIALAILAASGQIPSDKLKHAEFAGELALTGELRPVRGALAMALATRAAGRQLVLPATIGQRGGACQRRRDPRRDQPARSVRVAGWPGHADRAGRRQHLRRAGLSRLRRRQGPEPPPSAHSKSPRRAAIRVLMSARPAPASRCSPHACPASCRR